MGGSLALTWRYGEPRNATLTRTPQFGAVAGLILLGLICGIAAKSADGPTPWLNDLANYPAVYVFTLALIARFAPSLAQAALRSALFFAALCLAYYAWSAYVLDIGGGRFLHAWTGLSLTVVPLLAVAIRWAATESGVLPGLVMGTVAAIPLADGVLWQLWLRYGEDLLSGYPTHFVQVGLDLLFAVIIAGLLPRHVRTRTVALILTVPLAWAVTLLLDALRGTLGI